MTSKEKIKKIYDEFNIIEAVEYLKEHPDVKFKRIDSNHIFLTIEGEEVHCKFKGSVSYDNDNVFEIWDFESMWILQEQPNLVSINIDKVIEKIEKQSRYHITNYWFSEGLQRAIQIIKDNIKDNEKTE